MKMIQQIDKTRGDKKERIIWRGEKGRRLKSERQIR